MEPKTYWEKSIVINENVLDQLIQLMGDTNPLLQPVLKHLLKSWQGALEALDSEFKETPKVVPIDKSMPEHAWDVSADKEFGWVCTKCEDTFKYTTENRALPRGPCSG